MADWLKVTEFACKTARSLIVGKDAPTLPGPLDDGDLLAAAEEEQEVWEPRLETCVDCGKDFEVGHYARHSLHCKGPWWVERAVEAKAAKTDSCDDDSTWCAHDDDEPAAIAGHKPLCPCHFCSMARLFQRGPLPKSPAVSATDSAVEDPSPDVPPASGEADSLTWAQYVEPAICDVLANHQMHHHGGSEYTCCSPGESPHVRVWDQQEWREHVAPLIAVRLEKVTPAKDMP